MEGFISIKITWNCAWINECKKYSIDEYFCKKQITHDKHRLWKLLQNSEKITEHIQKIYKLKITICKFKTK